MKAKHRKLKSKRSPLHGRVAALFASLFLTSGVTLSAQTAVTGITYGSLSDAADRTIGNITYLNQYRPVTTISTSANTYAINGAAADEVYFRRNTSTTGSNNASLNNATAFYDYSSYSNGSATVYGTTDRSPTLSELMLSGNLNQGLRNPFANTNASNSLLTNIERMDFFFSGGYTVTGNEVLVFFDLENAGNFGDGFRIAAYTSVDGNNTPTAYANTGLLVQPDSFGQPVSTPNGGNSRYLRASTSSGDNLNATQTIATLDTNQGGSSELYLVGIAITFADLGISAGTKIYGYSLMAGDVVVGNNSSSTSRLVNWNNSSTYLTNTDAETWGNIDFMSFGGQIARPVPEPSTYGAILLASGVAFFGVRRWRAAKAAKA